MNFDTNRCASAKLPEETPANTVTFGAALSQHQSWTSFDHVNNKCTNFAVRSQIPAEQENFLPHRKPPDTARNLLACQAENMSRADKLTSAADMFQISDLHTPSPLLPAWNRGDPPRNTDMDADVKDELYFRPSDATISAMELDYYVPSVPSNQELNGCSAVGRCPSLNISRDSDTLELSQYSNSQRLIIDSRKVPPLSVQSGTKGVSMKVPPVQPQVPIRREKPRKRPPFSYMQLIQMAIASSPDLHLTLREIYEWVENRFPYYKYGIHQGWKNSIRHNLSLYDMFVRVKSSSGNRANVSQWTLRDTEATELTKNMLLTDHGHNTSDSENDEVCRRKQRLPSSSAVALSASVSEPPNAVVSSPSEMSLLVSAQKQRRVPVPLLPKPTASAQLPTTLTFVPVGQMSQDYATNVHMMTGEQRVTQAVPFAAQFETVKDDGTLSSARDLSSISLKRSADLAQSYQPRDSDLVPKLRLLSRSVSHTETSGDLPSMSGASSTGVVFNNSNHDDGSLLVASLDTSTLRHHLSDLHFSAAPRPEQNATDNRAKSASAILLSRTYSSDSTKRCNSSPKPVGHKNRRRKQEFSKLLQTPPNKLATSLRQRSSDNQVVSEEESGFGTSESGISTLEPELKIAGAEKPFHRSGTPPSQIRARSPVMDSAPLNNNMDDFDADDINLMLFTPFKTGADLSELSPDLGLSASIVAGSDSWVSFLPLPTSARTSTPCRLLQSTPKNTAKQDGDYLCRPSPGLSRLLSEFDDDELYPLGTPSGISNSPVTNLAATGAFGLDEGIGLDVASFNLSDLR